MTNLQFCYFMYKVTICLNYLQKIKLKVINSGIFAFISLYMYLNIYIYIFAYGYAYGYLWICTWISNPYTCVVILSIGRSSKSKTYALCNTEYIGTSLVHFPVLHVRTVCIQCSLCIRFQFLFLTIVDGTG